MADLINHRAVKNLAELCQIHHILLIHYSTDYVLMVKEQKHGLRVT